VNTLVLLEWIGTLTGIACVALAARAHVASWPLGLVSVSVYAVFFFQIRLYADSALQLFYVATGLYGWWHWTRGGPGHGAAPIRTLGNGARVGILAAGAAGTAATGWLLATRTDASLPYWDAFTTAFSIAAQLLLMRKILETWLLWIVVDVVAMGVYFVKEAYVTCGLYGVFLGLATWGWLTWRARHGRGA
jgi:nicotinamide mononucleotide transporter